MQKIPFTAILGLSQSSSIHKIISPLEAFHAFVKKNSIATIKTDKPIFKPTNFRCQHCIKILLTFQNGNLPPFQNQNFSWPSFFKTVWSKNLGFVTVEQQMSYDPYFPLYLNLSCDRFSTSLIMLHCNDNMTTLNMLLEEIYISSDIVTIFWAPLNCVGTVQ
jgi:hypothetical protein